MPFPFLHQEEKSQILHLFESKMIPTISMPKNVPYFRFTYKVVVGEGTLGLSRQLLWL